MLHARAPGKLILTGEHAVVYGTPALALAVAEYTHIRFKPMTESRTLNTLFSGISSGNHYPLHIFDTLRAKLDSRFEQFRAGELPIKHVLEQPDDLLIYTVSTLLKLFPVPGRPNMKSYVPMPGQLSGESALPVGAGMGSSAAAIAATLVLYEHMLEKPLTKPQRYTLINTCERLQHGKSSGIDAATVTHGGFVRYESGRLAHPELTLNHNWYRIYTGKPSASTGQCVEYVRQHHGNDDALWQAFNDVSVTFIDALSEENNVATDEHILTLMRENHRLLCRIGVVPDTVATLVSAIERAGGAAKVSGAGSVTGECGGMLIAYFPKNRDPETDKTFAEQFNAEPVKVDNDGALFLGSVMGETENA